MNKNIKMVAFDLDGTILDSEKKISERTKEAIKKACKQGVIVLPATGRPLTALPKEIGEMPEIEYAVTTNGASVINLKTGEMLFGSSISVDKACAVLDIFDEYDCHEEITIQGTNYGNNACLSHIYDYFHQASHAEYTLRTRLGVDSVREKMLEENKPLEKVQAFFRDETSLWEAKSRLDKIEGVVAANGIGNNWEVNCEGTDKGNALLELGRRFGIEKDEIMALGDGMNDYAMIQKVGFGVVMGNGEEELKQIASWITDTNDNDGAAKAIEKFVLGEVEGC